MILFNFLQIASGSKRQIAYLVLCKLFESIFRSLPIGIAFVIVSSYLMTEQAGGTVLESFSTWQAAALLQVFLLVAFAGQWLFADRGFRIGFSIGHELSSSLRVNLIRHLTQLPRTYFNERESGTITHVFMQDVALIELFPGIILPKLASTFMSPTIAVICFFIIDWRLGLVLLLSILIAIPAIVIGNKLMRETSELNAENHASFNAKAIEYIDGIAEIRSYSHSDDFISHAERAAVSVRNSSIKLTYKFVVPFVVVTTILSAGAAMGLLVATGLFTGGVLDWVRFFMVFLICFHLYSPIYDVADFSSLIQQMDVAMMRVRNILDTPVEAQCKLYKTPQNTVVRFKDVSFNYGRGNEGWKVDEMSFEIAEGKKIAFIGKTGSGKSTIGRLLQNLIQPVSGSVMIGGVDVREIDKQTLRSLVTVVPQDPVIYSDTVASNILLGRPDATREEVIAAAGKAQCDNFIQKLPNGYDTFLTGGGKFLSRGERQRLVLARAILRDSPIVILDEVTSALDVENEFYVQKAMSGFGSGKTIIVISHRLWTISNCDMIFVLRDGTIVEQGNHDDLMDLDGHYSILWQNTLSAPGWSRDPSGCSTSTEVTSHL